MNAAKVIVRSSNGRRCKRGDIWQLVVALHVRVIHLGIGVSAQTWKISRLIRIRCIDCPLASLRSNLATEECCVNGRGTTGAD